MSPRQRTIRIVDRDVIRGWVAGLAAALVTLAALIGGSTFESVQSTHRDKTIVGWIATGVLVVFGVMAVRRLSLILGRVVTMRTVASAGAAVRMLATGLGYLFLLFAAFGLTNVAIGHLLIGAGLAGVVLGIAAQQSLGNVFAGLLLLLAKTVRIGEHIRIRSGALGGVFDADVLEISLIYVTVRTEDGVLRIPNSAILAAAIGTLQPPMDIPLGDDEPVPSYPLEGPPGSGEEPR